MNRPWGRRSGDTFIIPLRTGWPSDERTLADVARDHPRPIDPTPHVHFHAHPTRHSHEHVHPSDHAHSARTDIEHEGKR